MTFFGFFVGVFGVVFGASMFLALPIFQLMFPGTANIGVLVGSIKVGSLARGIGSSLATREHLKQPGLRRYAPVFLGVLIGVLLISSLTKEFIVPVLLIAIGVTAYARAISKWIISRPGLPALVGLLVGIYIGFFGAGAALLIMAVIRIYELEEYGDDDKLILLQMQSRYLELLLGVLAVVGHIAVGTLIFGDWPMWLWWAIGSFFGGVVGGLLLTALRSVPPVIQRVIVYSSFALALAVAVLF
ncbi:MAG: hypothetical protein NXH72_14085 [Hyphomonadaceae bacterium]|nr:hypothetical protein [Hyphomonadaceae bacterium]